jgi:hypothetical protein
MQEIIATEKDSISILFNQINELSKKVDSIQKINNELTIHKTYFSDIIDTQMDWFALVFVITFGILGLSYWLGLYKYFQKKFSALELKNKDTKESLIARISIKDKINKNSIETINTVLTNKINSLEKLQSKLFQQKYDTLREDIDKLENNFSELISKTEQEIKEILESHKIEADKNKNSLFKEIWNTNFNTNRGMFFSTYNLHSYSSALTWLIPMLNMIATEKVDYKIDSFAEMANECAEKTKVDSTLKERFEQFVEDLKKAENDIENPDDKELIKKARISLNKTYYTNIKKDEEEEK